MSGKYDRDSREASGGVRGGAGASSEKKPPWKKAHEANGKHTISFKLSDVIISRTELGASTLIAISMAICDFIDRTKDKDILSSPLDPSRISVEADKTTGDWRVLIAPPPKDGYDSPYSRGGQAQEKHIYSLGKIMYEILVRGPLPEEPREDRVATYVRLQPGPVLLSDVAYEKFPGCHRDDGLAWIVSNAIFGSFFPFKSMGEFREALAAYREGKIKEYFEKLERTAEQEEASAKNPAPPAYAVPPSIMGLHPPQPPNWAARILIPLALAGAFAAGAYYFQDLKQLANKYLFGQKETAEEVQPRAPAPVAREGQEAHTVLLRISPKDALVQSVYYQWGKKKFGDIGTAKDGELEVKLYHESLTIRVKKDGYHSEEFKLTRSMERKEIFLSKKKQGEKSEEKAIRLSPLMEDTGAAEQPQEGESQTDNAEPGQPREGQPAEETQEKEKPEEGTGEEEAAEAPNPA